MGVVAPRGKKKWWHARNLAWYI